MKKLERTEMKNLKGGLNAPLDGNVIMSQSGWTLQGSNCYCDYHYTYPNGSTLDYCYIPCPTMCCNPSYGCSLAL